MSLKIVLHAKMSIFTSTKTQQSVQEVESFCRMDTGEKECQYGMYPERRERRKGHIQVFNMQ